MACLAAVLPDSACRIPAVILPPISFEGSPYLPAGRWRLGRRPYQYVRMFRLSPWLKMSLGIPLASFYTATVWNIQQEAARSQLRGYDSAWRASNEVNERRQDTPIRFDAQRHGSEPTSMNNRSHFALHKRRAVSVCRIEGNVSAGELDMRCSVVPEDTRRGEGEVDLDSLSQRILLPPRAFPSFCG